MSESVKTKIVLVLVILSAILFVSATSSCSKIRGLKRLKDEEMLARLTCQEEVKNIKEGLAQDLKSKDKELADEKNAHEATKKELMQGQLVNQGLKEELDKVSKVKQALEEALVNCKKSKR
jgi:cell shape-determining protein MreC